MPNKKPYVAGDWFAVPLKCGGYALGLTACASRGATLLGYFFGPRRDKLPTIKDTVGLTPDDAILIRMFGHLGLMSGEWPLIGHSAEWKPEEWPLPAFSHIDIMDSSKAYKREYDPKTLTRLVRQTRISPEEAVTMYEDGLSGHIALKVHLRRLLTKH